MLAMTHLEAAKARATALHLPGQEHVLLHELVTLYRSMGAASSARVAQAELRSLSEQLARDVNDERLRQGFLDMLGDRLRQD